MMSVLRRAVGLFGVVTVLLAAGAPAMAHEAHRQRAADEARAQAEQVTEARAAATTEASEQAEAFGTVGSAGPRLPSGAADPEAVPGHHGAMANMAMADTTNMTPLQRRQQMTFVERLSDWLGRWHRSIVHFPIALLLVALGLEAWAVIRRKPSIVSATRVLIAFGTLGALVAAFLGWMALGFDISQDDWIHRSHRVIGTIVPLLALATWYFRERSLNESGASKRLPYRVLLTMTGVAVAANGFLGGSMGSMGIAHLAW